MWSMAATATCDDIAIDCSQCSHARSSKPDIGQQLGYVG